jgi:hypothetical protein
MLINAKNNQYVNMGLPFLPSEGRKLTLLASFETIAEGGHNTLRIRLSKNSEQTDTLCERQNVSDLPRGTRCISAQTTRHPPSSQPPLSQKYKVHRGRTCALAVSFNHERVTTTFYIWPGLFHVCQIVTNWTEIYPSSLFAEHFGKCKTINKLMSYSLYCGGGGAVASSR